MIFLDTCIWIELLGVHTPIKEHEIRQAQAASNLLNTILETNEQIVTCEEQLLEIINAIQKVTMRTVNRERKQNQLPGVNNLKQFRQLEEFNATKELCKSVIEDVKHFAMINEIGYYDIDSILNRLEVADINDCLYYDYCTVNNVKFYTFDSDLKCLGESPILYNFDSELNDWIVTLHTDQ